MNTTFLYGSANPPTAVVRIDENGFWVNPEYPIDAKVRLAIEAMAAQIYQTQWGASPQPAQQDPVGHLLMGSKQDFVTTGSAGELEINVWHPVYTSPQRKPWVGLTDEDKCTVELVEAEVDPDWIDGYKSGLKDAEAKLKEKNG